MRAYDQALALPANDLAAATALLDARFLTGDRALADKFLAAFRARVAKTAAEDFVARLRAEQKERHSRFGDTIFLLEPDLKNGPGGLRDLCVGRWAAMARFGTSDPQQLLAQGVMTGRLAQAFTAATEWLMRVRILMHATAGRRQDHLRFALQEAIAPILYPEARDRGGVIRPAVHPAVEALMHQYHAHAKLIRNETERLLQRATAREEKRRKTQPVMVLGDRLGGKTADANFVVRDGALEPIDPGIFERKPSEIIRIFQLAIELDVPLALRTREQLGELAASQPGLLREDVEAGRRFVEICCDARDRANPSRLEQMQDLGMLAAIMPEWEPSTGRVQHDIYHVYTVDQHALYAVGRLHALQRGDHAAAFPVPTETVPEVTRPVALAIGTLLHDVGKPYGSPHSEIGAGLAVAICRRLGIEEEDTQRVEFLVRQHLVMGQMSQRRDLEDLGMISDFGAVCGNEENLRELYLLTFCDLASVAPDAMSSWKETLLAELYTRTLTFLRRGPDLLGSERAEIVAERQSGAARLLGEALPEGGAIAAGAAVRAGSPSRYFAENPETRIAAHVRLVRARREPGKSSLIDVIARPAAGDDRDGAGRRRHRPACSPTSRACCTPTGSRSSTRPSTRGSRPTRARRPRRWTCSACATAWAARSPPRRAGRRCARIWRRSSPGGSRRRSLVAGRPRTESVASWKTPVVPTECKIDNDVSRDFTVVEVITEDRPGVLYAIARTLFVAGLDIHRSKIATEANRAIDVFYVRDKATMDKITDPERQATCATRCSGCSPASTPPKLAGAGSVDSRDADDDDASDVGAAFAGRGRPGRAAAGEG